VRCYGLYIPLYGAYWAWPWPPTRWTRGAAPAQLRQRLAERRLPDLRYYNAEVHPALFALPNYYRDLVQPAPQAALPRARSASPEPSPFWQRPSPARPGLAAVAMRARQGKFDMKCCNLVASLL
jgi:hypothetical protein